MASHDIQSLYEIADNIESANRPRSRLDARTLLRLVENEALAFRNPSSNRLKELVDWYRIAQDLASSHPGSERMEQAIVQFFLRLDLCFFFGTLSRQVPTSMGRLQLVNLIIKDEIKQAGIPGFEKRGTWDPDGRVIWLWLRGIDGDTMRHYSRDMASNLHTIMHEAIHAFLGLFADEDHPLHDEQVMAAKGHGPVFCEMLRLIGDEIEDLTHSRRWREARHMGVILALAVTIIHQDTGRKILDRQVVVIQTISDRRVVAFRTISDLAVVDHRVVAFQMIFHPPVVGPLVVAFPMISDLLVVAFQTILVTRVVTFQTISDLLVVTFQTISGLPVVGPRVVAFQAISDPRAMAFQAIFRPPVVDRRVVASLGREVSHPASHIDTMTYMAYINVY
ncbi:hypothetical protein F4802DRAFT_601914 [Xylaria palmicola]|nr:hypothetical protein F4802DRAFT_601914 [Xylaria palmicola]